MVDRLQRHRDCAAFLVKRKNCLGVEPLTSWLLVFGTSTSVCLVLVDPLTSTENRMTVPLKLRPSAGTFTSTGAPIRMYLTYDSGTGITSR